LMLSDQEEIRRAAVDRARAVLHSRIDLDLPEHQQLISTPHWRLMVAKAN